MSWHVVSLNSRMEIETAARINSAGFVAHCPVFEKRIRCGRRGRGFMKLKTEPLFPGYIFVQRNDAFTKDLFETSKVKLMVFRKSFVTDAQMSVINSTALDLTMAQSKTVQALKIKRGDVMQILHGAMQGEPVDVLEVRRETIKVVLKRFSGAVPVTINAGSLGRAV